MTSRGQFNTKNPTIKRILKEASELASQPSPDYHAEPLESNLFEWHFTLRGPPAPSPYAAGIYHGRIVLPSTYPLRPPSFRFLTPTGRFEVNREICLSISGHHEETWQPAWGIRTALVAMRSFMDTDAKGQLGGLECDKAVRERMAREGGKWKCALCGKRNEEILLERPDEHQDAAVEESVPEELRLVYRDSLAGASSKEEPKTGDSSEKRRTPASPASASPQATSEEASTTTSSSITNTSASQQPAPTRTVASPRPQQLAQQTPDRSLKWIDTCIYGVIAALLLMVLRKMS